MNIFYDFEQDEYITKGELFRIFNQLKEENPSEYNYSFPHFVANCMSINNGSLWTIKQRIQKLEQELFFVKLDEFETGIDYSDDIIRIENELRFANWLDENGGIKNV